MDGYPRTTDGNGCDVLGMKLKDVPVDPDAISVS